MASNSGVVTDEDGDASDWFELHNYGESPINLDGFAVADDNRDFWEFPAFELGANEYLLIFASDKDRSTPPVTWKTVIDKGDEWRYLLPSSEPAATWRNAGFNDSGWSTGATSIGYGDGDDATVVPNTTSVFLRKTFQIENVQDVVRAFVHVDYDDGFVAFLNGTEIARRGLSGEPPAFNTFATDHEAVIYTGGMPEGFEIQNIGSLLQTGENVLAVQVHNATANSSDLTIIPILSLGFAGGGENELSEFVTLGQSSFHTHFKISASVDTLFLRNPQGEISETLPLANMLPDISWGRAVAGESWVYFEESTPGAANTTTGYTSISGGVNFSATGGRYPSAVQVALVPEAANDRIHYTLDGSLPTSSSPQYSSVIQIASSKVLRVRAMSDGSLPGPVITQSYLINVPHTLPIVSIAADPHEFFDPQEGMYVMGPNAEQAFPHFGANFWQEWERPVNLELYEPNGTKAFTVRAGAQIFGGWSRGNAQKSLSLFFRNSYGDGDINYRVFPNKDLEVFSSLVLRNSGNDWNNTMMRDGLLTGLFHLSVDKQAYRPAVLYINGEYWGIQNIREKVNEHFLANNHGVKPGDVQLMEANSLPIHGDEAHYLALIEFVTNNNLTNEANYAQVQAMMDIDNFIYYYTGNIFVNNTDWPGNNIKYWRENSPEGKWRWITYDTDFGFGIWDRYDYTNNTLNFALNANGPEWPNPPWSTLLLRRLMTNQEFKNRFINLFADQLNTNFATAHVQAQIEAKSSAIQSEIARHMTRWGGDLGHWYNQIDAMHEYAQERPGHVKQHIRSRFGIGGEFDLTVNVSNAAHGQIRVNNLDPVAYPWTGSYFDGIPVSLTAIPKPGFRFVRWEGDATGVNNVLALTSALNTSVRAVFEPADGEELLVVINEIYYKSPETPEIEDWIELYNPGSGAINLSGWVLKDDDDTHAYVFPENTTIGGNAFLVVCIDRNNFISTYGSNIPSVGNTGFGLSANGDCVRIYDSEGQEKDQVCFGVSSPWPTQPNGSGYSLALIRPDLDNTLAASWFAVPMNGNPGEVNVPDEALAIPPAADFSFTAAPNPAAAVVRLTFSLWQQESVQLSVFDLTGKRVQQLAIGTYPAGTHQMQWDAADLAKGVYLIRLSTPQGFQSLRFQKN